MRETLRRVQTLVLGGDFRVSEHGFDELEDDAIVTSEVIGGIAAATAIEDYPDRSRVRVFLSCSTTQMAVPFTSSGQSRRASAVRLCW
jgi:hypothetical protein